MIRPYTILAALLATPLLAQQAHPVFQPHPEGKHSSHVPAVKMPLGAPKGSSYYTESFDSSLNGWTVVSGVGNVDWAWTNTGPGPTSSTYPVPVLNTSTPSGWAIFDDDFLGQSGVLSESSIVSPVIDLSTAPANLKLEFDQFFQEFSDPDVDTYVGISTDGGTTWNETALNNGVGRDGRPNPELVDVNISSWVAANPSNVQIRFRYRATWDYGWQVDNIVINELPDNDMALLEMYKTGFSFGNTGVADMDYTIYPVEQVRPMLLHGKVKNKGFLDQTNVTLNATVTGPGGVEFTGASAALATSAADQVDSLAVEGFTPSGTVGTYTVKLEVTQNEGDQNLTNNEKTQSFEVNECIWAHDNGVCEQAITAGPDNLTDQTEIGNYFDVANAGSFLYGVDIALEESTTAGILIYASVRDENLDQIAVSAEYDVDAATLNTVGGTNFFTIVFDDPIELLQGNAYCVMVGGYGGADQIHVATSGISAPQVSIIHYPQAATPNAFYTTRAPMVRAILSASCAGVGIAENNGSVSGVQAWPNPFSETADIRFDLNTGANVTVELRDMTGRLIQVERLGHRAAGAQQVRFNGLELADGVYSYTINADGARTTGTLVHARH
ncbi:MAG: T9SS type A sorting domain-containing protein [Flavobacteriales bacterium]|nr:T9SS type A sorting domain-containing protein [Flavobacteriales bacterium]